MPTRKIGTKKIAGEESKVIQMLSQAGWSKTTRGQVFDKASMKYKNKTMILELEYEGDSVSLLITTPGGKSGHLAISFDDKLQELLSLIVSVQDIISPASYKDCVRKILALFPDTYVELENGEFRRLTNE